LALDYRLFADARDIDYLGIICNRGIVENKDAYRMGCFGDFGKTIYDLDISPIIQFINQH
jgi:hypothetical protein